MCILLYVAAFVTLEPRTQPEDPEDIEEFGEDSEMPWKEMREKWFHSNTHENELDFWKKRANTTDKSALYYGNQMGIV